MEITHYQALFISYGVAMVAWLAANRLIPNLWPVCAAPYFEKPGKELGLALLSMLGILAIGQLYQAGIRLPSSGAMGQIFESVNQFAIFSPVFLLLYFRKQPLSTAWLPVKSVWLRIVVGLVLALIAIFVFTWFRSGSDGWLTVIQRVYHYQNLSHLVQVFCEDVTIAILFIRIKSVIGLRGAIILVASLFALGHIPAMISTGASFSELSSLIIDTMLGIGVVFILQKSSDIFWFWMIHFAMDMMQFYAVP